NVRYCEIVRLVVYLSLHACRGPVLQQLPALLGILQVRDHDLFENLLMYRRILQWTEDFDAPVEVPRHHVGRRDIHSRFRAGQALTHTKAVDPAVLEEAADDRLDPDIFRKACYAGPQAAD